MEYGLIKDTTIQTIADSLRDKGILTKYKKAPKKYNYKTANATSLEDPTPVGVAKDKDKIAINASGATSVEVVIDFAFSEAQLPCQVRVSYKDYINSWTNAYLDKATESPLVLRVPSDSYEIEFYYDSTVGHEFGAILTAYPLDANGDKIFIDSEEIQGYAPSKLAEAVGSLLPPPSEEAFMITDSCNYRFARDGWNWFIKQYGDRVITKDLTDLSYMFAFSKNLEEIPFVINVKDCYALNAAFNNCEKLKVCPKVRGQINHTLTYSVSNFQGLDACYMLRDVEDLFEPEMLEDFAARIVTSTYTSNQPARFSSCYSLRRIPSWWYKFRLNPESTTFPNYSYTLYNSMLQNCYCLDEITDIPVWACKAAQTSNMFSGAISKAARLKEFTFETNNGQPIETKWKSQVLDFSNDVGYGSTLTHIYFTGNNSGITLDKQVSDDATYQALKNDPDWFALSRYYSRYDHDSAVRTINSLPDTSTYLASAGGTNTIKFEGDAGFKTDGGAISTLTEEEIAVAAAKGWTVTLV